MVFQGCTFCWPPLYLKPRFLRPTSNWGKEGWAKLGQLLMIMVVIMKRTLLPLLQIHYEKLWNKITLLIMKEHTFVIASFVATHVTSSINMQWPKRNLSFLSSMFTLLFKILYIFFSPNFSQVFSKFVTTSSKDLVFGCNQQHNGIS